MYRSNIQKKPQYFHLLHLFIKLFAGFSQFVEIGFMSKNSAHEGRFEKVASYKFPPNLTQSRHVLSYCCEFLSNANSVRLQYSIYIASSEEILQR